MEKPDMLPEWATNELYEGGPDAGMPTKLVVSAGEMADGYHRGHRPPARKLNWLLNKFGEWVKYLDEFSSQLKSSADFHWWEIQRIDNSVGEIFDELNQRCVVRPKSGSPIILGTGQRLPIEKDPALSAPLFGVNLQNGITIPTQYRGIYRVSYRFNTLNPWNKKPAVRAFGNDLILNIRDIYQDVIRSYTLVGSLGAGHGPVLANNDNFVLWSGSLVVDLRDATFLTIDTPPNDASMGNGDYEFGSGPFGGSTQIALQRISLS